MRVFVTGATGFIGFSVVKELLAAGHRVTGPARSAASAGKLRDVGAEVRIGGVEDLDGLRRAASEAEGAIHTAFYHKISHMALATQIGVFLGGLPTRIPHRFFAAAVATDRRAIETIGAALPGKGSPFVATFGTLSMKSGRLATEDDSYDRDAPLTAGRARNEDVLKSFAAHGVRACVIRLPPIVHGPGQYGLASLMFQRAQKRGESAFPGEGSNRWPSAHRDDVAHLFRLALEGGASGAYHGVAEEGVPMREIAAAIGKRLNLPVVAKAGAEVARHFGFIAPFVPIDNPASSALTRERLGWNATGVGVLADLEQAELPKG